MNDIISKLPEFISGAYELYQAQEDCFLYLFRNVRKDAFLEYCQKLSLCFSLVDENEIESNLFRFFKGDGFSVSAGYFPSEESARIVIDRNGNLPDFIEKKVLNKYGTTFWQFEVDHSLIDCGMCYVFKTRSGKFFVIDSPHTYSINDCERIHSFLREKTPKGEKIHIAGWFFSHGHEDHITQFISFLRFFSDDVIIDNVYHNFISLDHPHGSDWMDCLRGYYDMFFSALREHPEINVIRLHTGQTFFVENLKVDVLCSHEDVFPEDNSNFNDSSVVLMVTAEGSKILIPGDAGHEESYILERRYPKYLKADIVQQAHHGHFGTTDNFYRLVDAKVALFPVTQIKFDEELEHWSANKVSLDICDEYYIASNGTVEIPLPYDKSTVKLYPDETFESFKGVYDLWSYEYPVEYKRSLYEAYLERGGKPLEEYKNGF